jgi:hypothetical protein
MEMRIALLCAGALMLGLTTITAEAHGQTAPAVLQTMSVVEQRATGVDRLTAAERARLEEWITRLSTNVAQLAASSACQMAPTPVVTTALESRIAGDFTGWDGATVFYLENGQVWQQTSFDRLAVYIPRPRVSFISSGTGWRMSVEGLGPTVPVRRVR